MSTCGGAVQRLFPVRSVPPLVELLLFLVLLFLIAVAAGFVGSLTGIGGGIVVIPILVIFFQVPFVEAVGAGFITILANSATTGAAYVHEGLTDLRIGMVLEIATVPGALLGASLTILLTRYDLTAALMVALAIVLILGSISTVLRRHEDVPQNVVPDRTSQRLGLTGSYHDARSGDTIVYQGANTTGAFGVMFGAGVVSGMFGIGSGVLKVFALDGALRLPFKVATATSNFMIGVTACAGAGVLLAAGYINPVLAAPIALGATVGAVVGSRILPGASTFVLRMLFVVVVCALSIELIVQALGGP